MSFLGAVIRPFILDFFLTNAASISIYDQPIHIVEPEMEHMKGEMRSPYLFIYLLIFSPLEHFDSSN
jgi:hypothetical protein